MHSRLKRLEASRLKLNLQVSLQFYRLEKLSCYSTEAPPTVEAGNPQHRIIYQGQWMRVVADGEETSFTTRTRTPGRLIFARAITHGHALNFFF